MYPLLLSPKPVQTFCISEHAAAAISKSAEEQNHHKAQGAKGADDSRD